MDELFVLNISIILFSGFVAGVICKYFKASPLIGYLVVGALIGPGGLDLTRTREYQKELEAEKARIAQVEEERAATLENYQKLEEASKTESKDFRPDSVVQENVNLRREISEIKNELEKQWKQGETLTHVVHNSELERMHEGHYALEAANEFGVLLLLFAIGIEFTFAQLASTAKYMFVGGTLQMGLTIGLGIAVCIIFKLSWIAGLALGSVVALSSTALVYKSFGDLGQADTKRAQATLGLLIFQDVALVPLLLILPIVLGAGDSETSAYWFGNPWVDMALKSTLFCAIVLALKKGSRLFIVPFLANLRSNDVVILYAIVVLAGMCVVASALGLTPALGALAAGIVLGENRLTHQIDALVLPFREAFSAMFFISLGMLTDFSYVFHHPGTCILALVGAVAFKALCATFALRACGMDKKGALAFGVSISQIGELAFMLLSVAFNAQAINETTYNTMLFVSVASLVLTPNMVKIALTKFGMPPEEPEANKSDEDISPALVRAINNAKSHAVIVGAGPMGRTVAKTLLVRGRSVCLVDLNPVNLQPFKQSGVPTVQGNGMDYEVLQHAGIGRAQLVFVTAPNDAVSLEIVKSARALNPTVAIAARTRFGVNVAPLERAGAQLVLCEEETIAADMVVLLERHFAAQAATEAARKVEATAPQVSHA